MSKIDSTLSYVSNDDNDDDKGDDKDDDNDNVSDDYGSDVSHDSNSGDNISDDDDTFLLGLPLDLIGFRLPLDLVGGFLLFDGSGVGTDTGNDDGTGTGTGGTDDEVTLKVKRGTTCDKSAPTLNVPVHTLSVAVLAPRNKYISAPMILTGPTSLLYTNNLSNFLLSRLTYNIDG